MNGDGTGDTALALPFGVFEFPTWSRNGRLLALTAADPASTIQRGQNVFAIDAVTGGIRQITFDIDLVGNGVVVYKFPYFKAFSPDGSAMAVFSRVQMGEASGPGESQASRGTTAPRPCWRSGR